MITYIEHTFSRQEDYGIEIPLLSTRPQQILQKIRASRYYEHVWEHAIQALGPLPLARKNLELVHDKAYVARLFSKNDAEEEVIQAYELRTPDGRWYRYNPDQARRSLSELVQLQLIEAQGSLESAQIAVAKKFCYFLGGGMHHAMADKGRGFCMINDIMIIAHILIQTYKWQNIWVIDVDAHKGDGTASLAYHHPLIHTLSIHMQKGWPLDTTPPDDPRVLIASDYDIDIPANEESRYVEALATGLQQMQAQFGPPDFVIVVNGSDPYEGDVLPSASLLRLSLAQLLERDQLVYNFFSEKDIAQLWLMAGGYGEAVAEVHSQFLEWRLSHSHSSYP